MSAADTEREDSTCREHSKQRSFCPPWLLSRVLISQSTASSKPTTTNCPAQDPSHSSPAEPHVDTALVSRSSGEKRPECNPECSCEEKCAKSSLPRKWSVGTCDNDVGKTRSDISAWYVHGQRRSGAWDQPHVRGPSCAGPHSPYPSLTHGSGSQAGMSWVSVRKCRQLVGVCVPLATVFYLLLCSSSLMWSSLGDRHHPLDNTLSGSGFRKLLEEQERARLSTSNVTSNSALTQRLPTCIIIGVRKCGTRALLEFLDLHPSIVTADLEMHFFNDDERYRLGLDWYRHHMPLSLPHQITIEKTPGYFISPITPSRIHRMNSTIKLIVLLRHPTTRAVSDYTQIYHNKQAKNETLEAFEDIAIDGETGSVNTRYRAVQISMYHQYFRYWMDVFPRHQIHVVDGDRLITDPISEIRQIEDFLGLEHRVDHSMLYYNSTRGFYCMRKSPTLEKCLGASKGRKHPSIEQSVIRKLNRFFQPHNKQLFDLIQQRFSWS